MPDWKVESHNQFDKWYPIRGPGGLFLWVDNDDVDHEQMDLAIEALVSHLNRGQFYLPLAFFCCGSEDCERHGRIVRPFYNDANAYVPECPECGGEVSQERVSV